MGIVGSNTSVVTILRPALFLLTFFNFCDIVFELIKIHVKNQTLNEIDYQKALDEILEKKLEEYLPYLPNLDFDGLSQA